MKKLFVKKMILILFVSSLFVCVPLRSQSVATSASSQAAGKDPISKRIEALIEKAVARVKAIRDMFKPSNIKTYLKEAKFLGSSKVSILSSAGDGIVIERGYFGSGNVSISFKGVKPKFVINGLPEEWEPVVENMFPWLSAVQPAQEWLFNVILLLNDKANNRISSANFFVQLNLLFLRLANTSGYDSISKVLGEVSPLLKNVLQAVQIQNKSAIDFLENYYKQFRKILLRHFPKKLVDGKFVKDDEYKPNGSKLGDSQARTLLLSILMRSFLFYSELKAGFENTDSGKAAAKKLQDAFSEAGKLPSIVDRVKKRVEAVEVYNKQLPGFPSLKSRFLIVELARLFSRLKNEQFKKALESFLNPFLNPLGLSLDLILNAVTTEAVEQEPPAPIEFEEFEYIDIENLDVNF